MAYLLILHFFAELTAFDEIYYENLHLYRDLVEMKFDQLYEKNSHHPIDHLTMSLLNYPEMKIFFLLFLKKINEKTGINQELKDYDPKESKEISVINLEKYKDDIYVFDCEYNKYLPLDLHFTEKSDKEKFDKNFTLTKNRIFEAIDFLISEENDVSNFEENFPGFDEEEKTILKSFMVVFFRYFKKRTIAISEFVRAMSKRKYKQGLIKRNRINSGKIFKEKFQLSLVDKDLEKLKEAFKFDGSGKHRGDFLILDLHQSNGSIWLEFDYNEDYLKFNKKKVEEEIQIEKIFGNDLDQLQIQEIFEKGFKYLKEKFEEDFQNEEAEKKELLNKKRVR